MNNAANMVLDSDNAAAFGEWATVVAPCLMADFHAGDYIVIRPVWHGTAEGVQPAGRSFEVAIVGAEYGPIPLGWRRDYMGAVAIAWEHVADIDD